MCSIIYFQKREMLFLILNRGKLHDNKKKNLIGIERAGPGCSKQWIKLSAG
jgi:hypothetical protein